MAEPDDPTRARRRAAARSAREAQERAEAGRITRRTRLGVLGGGVVALAVVVVAVLLATSSPDKAQAPAAAPAEAVGGQSATTTLLAGIPQNGRALGAARAPVTLVEFADLQCPFCKQYAQAALPTVIEDYVRAGKVRLEFRPLTFIGPDSVTAARTVVAAGAQDKLWDVLDRLYANQGAEGSGWVTQPLLDRVIKAAGGDVAATTTAAKTSPAVSRDLAAADALATRYAITSTPSFLAGKTGGALQRLEPEALTGAAFSSALDQVLAQ